MYHLGVHVNSLPYSYLLCLREASEESMLMKGHLRNVKETKDMHLVHMGCSAN